MLGRVSGGLRAIRPGRLVREEVGADRDVRAPQAGNGGRSPDPPDATSPYEPRRASGALRGLVPG
ncbi:hypothetical protein AB0H03_41505, partial [Streptomyces sparsogenes]|uniref:hypothetical protein n=1 Tax=Streptomyces sparsogenes TaxID=67365 RepID=UPI0034101C96